MESHMVKENDYISYIKCYFEENIPDYPLSKESFHGPFWHVEYQKDGINITISGDIGFQIVIDFLGTKYPLWQYDYSVSEKGKTTIENIEYQLVSLKKLLIGLNEV